LQAFFRYYRNRQLQYLLIARKDKIYWSFYFAGY